jgi:hypothetical protein
MPAVTVIMPPAAARRHPVELLLCGHHYRASQGALRAAGATVYDRAGAVVTPGPGWEPAAGKSTADTRQRVTR